MDRIENHSFFEPILIPGIIPFFITTRDSWEKFRWFVPSLLRLWRELGGASARTLVVRDRGIFSRLAVLLFRLRGGARSLLYVQEPRVVKSEKSESSSSNQNRKWEGVLGSLPSKVVSPVWPQDQGFDSRRNLPFVIESRFFRVGMERFASPVPNRRLKLLVVGKFRPYKGILEMLTLLGENRIISDSLVNLTLVGECASDEDRNYLGRVEDLIEKKFSSVLLEIALNVDHKEMHEIYRRHDVFLLPSRREVASVSVLEAAASGMATLSSNENGTACYLPRDSSATFDWEKPDMLLENLRGYISSPTRIRKDALITFRHLSKFACLIEPTHHASLSRRR